MAAIDSSMVSKILNATTPTGAAGVPGTWTALSAAAMKLRLTSTASTSAAAGTTITGTGYADQAVGQSTASTAGSSVTVPVAATSWTNGSGGTWSIVSFELIDGAGVRTWYGNFNGQPISVANGNTFQIAAGGITISLT